MIRTDGLPSDRKRKLPVVPAIVMTELMQLDADYNQRDIPQENRTVYLSKDKIEHLVLELKSRSLYGRVNENHVMGFDIKEEKR